MNVKHKLPILFVATILFSCATQHDDKNKEKNIIKTVKAPAFEEINRNASTGEFYTAIKINSLWSPASTECIDKSAESWVRKIFKKDAAEYSVIAEIKHSTETNPQNFPLFIIGKSESTKAGEPNCYSATISKQLTPWYKAEASSNFDINFKMGTKDAADFAGAKNIASALQTVLTYSGSNNFIVKKLTKEQLDNAAKVLDKSISEHLSLSTLDNGNFQLDSANGDPTVESDGLEFSAIKPTASASGVTLENSNVPAFRIGLIYKESVFKKDHEKKYPSYTNIITAELAPKSGAFPSSLKTLMTEDDSGNMGGNLTGIKTADSAEFSCRQLKTMLSRGFTSNDALVSRYAILRIFAPQTLKTKEIYSEECLSQTEKKALEEFGYEVPENSTDIRRRDEEVAEKMNEIVAAMRRGSADTIAEKSIDNGKSFRIMTLRGRTVLPDYSETDKSWDAAGVDALDKLIAFGTNKTTRIGCYQAPPNGAVNQIGAVSNYSGLTLGLLFNFDESQKLESLIIGDIQDIKHIGSLGNTFGASPSCPLA